MRYEWEAHDIFVGRQIASHNRTENYIIGYDPAVGSNEDQLAVISLRDGMITCKRLSKLGIADYLNHSNYRPNTIHNEDVGPT